MIFNCFYNFLFIEYEYITNFEKKTSAFVCVGIYVYLVIIFLIVMFYWKYFFDF